MDGSLVWRGQLMDWWTGGALRYITTLVFFLKKIQERECAALKPFSLNSAVHLWSSRADGEQMRVTNQTPVLAAYGG